MFLSNLSNKVLVNVIKPLAVLTCITTASVVLALSQYEPIGLNASAVSGDNTVIRCDVALTGGPSTVQITSVPAGVVNYSVSVNNAQTTVYAPIQTNYSGSLTLQLRTQGGTQVVSTTMPAGNYNQ